MKTKSFLQTLCVFYSSKLWQTFASLNKESSNWKALSEVLRLPVLVIFSPIKQFFSVIFNDHFVGDYTNNIEYNFVCQMIVCSPPFFSPTWFLVPDRLTELAREWDTPWLHYFRHITISQRHHRNFSVQLFFFFFRALRSLAQLPCLSVCLTYSSRPSSSSPRTNISYNTAYIRMDTCVRDCVTILGAIFSGILW